MLFFVFVVLMFLHKVFFFHTHSDAACWCTIRFYQYSSLRLYAFYVVNEFVSRKIKANTYSGTRFKTKSRDKNRSRQIIILILSRALLKTVGRIVAAIVCGFSIIICYAYVKLLLFRHASHLTKSVLRPWSWVIHLGSHYCFENPSGV